MAGERNDRLRWLNPKCGGKKRFAILAEYLGWGEVLSIFCEEERRNNIMKEIVQPVGHVLRLLKPC